jgi:hypothetical protein
LIETELIRKRFPDKTDNQKGVEESFKNEIMYLIEKGGSTKCVFINNYYLLCDEVWAEDYSDLKRKKIYSDYHKISVWEKFSKQNNQKYTMSDIINLAEQLMCGLMDFYL